MEFLAVDFSEGRDLFNPESELAGALKDKDVGILVNNVGVITKYAIDFLSVSSSIQVSVVTIVYNNIFNCTKYARLYITKKIHVFLLDCPILQFFAVTPSFLTNTPVTRFGVTSMLTWRQQWR